VVGGSLTLGAIRRQRKNAERSLRTASLDLGRFLAEHLDAIKLAWPVSLGEVWERYADVLPRAIRLRSLEYAEEMLEDDVRDARGRATFLFGKAEVPLTQDGVVAYGHQIAELATRYLRAAATAERTARLQQEHAKQGMLDIKLREAATYASRTDDDDSRALQLLLRRFDNGVILVDVDDWFRLHDHGYLLQLTTRMREIAREPLVAPAWKPVFSTIAAAYQDEYGDAPTRDTGDTDCFYVTVIQRLEAAAQTGELPPRAEVEEVCRHCYITGPRRAAVLETYARLARAA